MNRERTATAAAVMLAYAQGKAIQFQVKGHGSPPWHDVIDQPLWCWTTHDFRIKPQVVKSRRYLARTPLGQFWVGTVSTFDETDEVIETRAVFVRWIDADWVETEI